MWKFSLIYFLLIMLPIFAVGQISYNQFIKTTIQQSDKEMNQKIAQLKQQVVTMIQNTEGIAGEIIFTSESQAFLNNQFVFSKKESNQFIYNLQNILIRVKQVYPNQYFKIRFFSSNESIGEVYDVIYSIKRLQDEPFYSAIKNAKKNVLWGDLKQVQKYQDVEQYFKVQPNKNLALSFYEQVLSYDSNEIIGVLEIAILASKMFNGYYLNPASQMLVLDKNDAIINAEKSLFEGEISQAMLENHQGVKEILINNEKYRIVYDTVEMTGYKIIAFIKVESLLSGLKGYRNRMMIIMVLAIIGVFSFVYGTTNLLFSRFRLMIKMMNRIQKGELDVKIDEDRQDEIGQLAHNFNLMTEKLQEMVLDLIEKETAHRDAEIRALQAQVNPHFLYNTLDGIRMQCEMRKQYDIAGVMVSLSELLRYNTKWTSDLVPLKDEIEHVVNYITIMETRFKDKIRFNVDIPELLLKHYVIKMMIQPLIENIFKYAFNRSKEIWEISLSGYTLDSVIYIKVQDNGNGIEEETLRRINEHLENNISMNRANGSVGLWNVNQRIKVHFGDNYGLKVESQIDQGTEVTIYLPISDQEVQTEVEATS